MFDLKLKVKILLLLVIGVLTVSAGLGGGTTSASCGKCGGIVDSNGNNIGYACIQTGRHHCVATTEGCDFPGLCDGSGGGGDGIVIEE
jgi:hypothetical protein